MHEISVLISICVKALLTPWTKQDIHLHLYLLYASSEGSGESAPYAGADSPRNIRCSLMRYYQNLMHWHIPADTWRQDIVVSTSMWRHVVASTLIWRCFKVVRLLGYIYIYMICEKYIYIHWQTLKTQHLDSTSFNLCFEKECKTIILIECKLKECSFVSNMNNSLTEFKTLKCLTL